MGLNAIPESVKKKIEQLVNVIKSEFEDSEILLFGSFARGDWLEDSDLDILLISDKFEGVEYIKSVAHVKNRTLEKRSKRRPCHTSHEKRVRRKKENKRNNRRRTPIRNKNRIKVENPQQFFSLSRFCRLTR